MSLKKTSFLVFSIFSSFLFASITIDGKLDEPEWQKAQSINDFVTSSDEKSFFLIPLTIFVKDNSEILDILLNNLWNYKKFIIIFWRIL